MQSSHLDANGNAVMVDVSGKHDTARVAVAEGRILLSPTAMQAVCAGSVAKGSVLGVARIAGIMAAKKTSELIPLCHPLPLTCCSVDFHLEEDAIRVLCTAKTENKTGVEMEALTGVSVALLTIYDMCKSMDKGMTMTEVRLLRKDGGKSGPWRRAENAVHA